MFCHLAFLWVWIMHTKTWRHVEIFLTWMHDAGINNECNARCRNTQWVQCRMGEYTMSALDHRPCSPSPLAPPSLSTVSAHRPRPTVPLDHRPTMSALDHRPVCGIHKINLGTVSLPTPIHNGEYHTKAVRQALYVLQIKCFEWIRWGLGLGEKCMCRREGRNGHADHILGKLHVTCVRWLEGVFVEQDCRGGYIYEVYRKCSGGYRRGVYIYVERQVFIQLLYTYFI